MATVYGYARVSSRDQNLNRQLDALGAYGVGSANIYADHASGKDFDRPRYRELLHVLGDGDVLVVLSIDRLGRNYSEILEEWRRITKELGVAIAPRWRDRQPSPRAHKRLRTPVDAQSA